MPKQSERWKTLERTAASKLSGERVPRWLDFGQSSPDVLVPDFKLVNDVKAHSRFSHHSLMENIERKYYALGEIPCLVTKAAGQRGEYVTLPLDTLADLLREVRMARKGPEK